MLTQIELGDITVDIELKDIKNVHLSVYPPNGRVRIAAPSRMDIETIRVYAISKLGWIKRQQRKFREQDRETIREYIDRESHFVWGKRYLLKVIEVEEAPSVELRYSEMILRVRPGADFVKKEQVVEEWYRRQLRQAAFHLIEKWEPTLGVQVGGLYIQRMKTKWGSCNPVSGNIRLNTGLAKKPEQCLEYIIVHELVHLLEPTHNDRFTALLDRYLPSWKLLRDELNQAPLSHVDWEY